MSKMALDVDDDRKSPAELSSTLAYRMKREREGGWGEGGREGERQGWVERERGGIVGEEREREREGGERERERAAAHFATC